MTDLFLGAAERLLEAHVLPGPERVTRIDGDRPSGYGGRVLRGSRRGAESRPDRRPLEPQCPQLPLQVRQPPVCPGALLAEPGRGGEDAIDVRPPAVRFPFEPI